MKKNINRKCNLFLVCIFVISCLTTKAFGESMSSRDLVEKLDGGKVTLTASFDDKTYSYKNFKLKIGEKEQNFNWGSIGKQGFEPSLKYIDLGKNKKQGVAVFLVESEGTGVYMTRVHIFDINSFKEIPVEDPFAIIQKSMKIDATPEGMVIDLNGKKTLLDKNYLSQLGIRNPNIRYIYNNIVIYGEKDNNLFAQVGLSDENLFYFGNINIDYLYKDGAFKMDKISFEKYR